MNCQHNWVSAVNEYVTTGEVCTRCKSLRCDDGAIIQADYEGADIGEPIPSAGRLRATDRPIIPGNERPKAGKPSYEELEAVLCGLEGERNLTKRRVVSEEMQREFAAMGGKVVKQHGEIVVLCDFAEVTRHFGSS